MAKSRIITGMGIVFNSQSEDLGGFREVIRPEAVGKDGKILKESDVWFLMNHQREQLLARSREGKGSLKLTVLPEGVRYSFTAPDSPKGAELVSYLERGEVNASSFAFVVAPKGEIWEKRKTDYLRTVTAFGYIYDISSVFDAAYKDTSCELREGVPSGNIEAAPEMSTRSNQEWIEGHNRARISGEPSADEFKMANVLQLLDLREGDRVTGDELTLMVRQIEERGVTIPCRRFAALTHKQQHEFRMAYLDKAKDLKPHIDRVSEEERRLTAEYEEYKRMYC